MRGKVKPRSTRVYEDWARLLRTDRPPSWLVACTVDAFVEEACRVFAADPEELERRAGLDGSRPGADLADLLQRLNPEERVAVIAALGTAFDPETIAHLQNPPDTDRAVGQSRTGSSSGADHPTMPRPSPGLFGAATVSSAHDDVTGSDALAMNSGCRTRTDRRTPWRRQPAPCPFVSV